MMNALDLLDLIDFLVGALAAIALGGLMCRLDKLRYGRHKLNIIAFHGALACSCGFAMFNAWQREAGALDLFVTIAALSWLWVSFATWRRGDVPRQFMTRPQDLSTTDLREVSGGKS